MKRWIRPIYLLAGLWLLAAACDFEPDTIRYGEEECDHCRMLISDPPFAAQLVTDRGRHFKFDAIECLAAYVLQGTYEPAGLHAAWVPRFDKPEQWMEAKESHYLRSDELNSPMSLNFSAYPTILKAEEQQKLYGGEIYTWYEIKETVDAEWFGN